MNSMAQYQSFPSAPGDSLTLDKLKKLTLPDLAGQTFLDVGCNEGFFCGFAKHQGATRSVGIDHSRGFIERARRRFPDCEFHARGWDQLPEGRFDVILLASALHYAHDQAALIHLLMDRLADDGTLVLELGIVTSKQAEWVKVQRGSDQRLFPTMPLLKQLLADYAWKWMGPSVLQAGDPVARHVLHISRRRHAAYLLMQPPAFGKSSIARSLFSKAGLPVVSGDLLIGQVAAGKLQASPALAGAIAKEHSPFRLDLTIQRIFDRGLGQELVALWLQHAGDGDFALDMYVPGPHQAAVKQALSRAGYMPVVLEWERPGARLVPDTIQHKRAEAFYLSLSDRALPEAPAATPTGLVGCVDDATVARGQLSVRGWAADATGAMPTALALRVGNDVHVVEAFEKQLRPDVQRHMALPHALVGWRVVLPMAALADLADLGPDFAVRGLSSQHESPVFRLSGPLAAKLATAGKPPG